MKLTNRLKTRRLLSQKQLAARTGNASIDSVLVLTIILPLAAFLFLVVPRMITLVYQMTVTIIASPLM